MWLILLIIFSIQWIDPMDNPRMNYYDAILKMYFDKLYSVKILPINVFGNSLNISEIRSELI